MAKKIKLKEDNNDQRIKVPQCNSRKQTTPPSQVSPVGPATHCNMQTPIATQQAVAGSRGREIGQPMQGLQTCESECNITHTHTVAMEERHTKANLSEFHPGLLSLIDKVCTSELNTPDIKVFENIDFEGEARADGSKETCFDFPVPSFTEFVPETFTESVPETCTESFAESVPESSSMEAENQDDEQQFADCTPSPDFYSDHFDKGENLMDSFEGGANASAVKMESIVETFDESKEFTQYMSVLDGYLDPHINGSGAQTQQESTLNMSDITDVTSYDNNNYNGNNLLNDDHAMGNTYTKYLTNNETTSNYFNGSNCMTNLNLNTPDVTNTTTNQIAHDVTTMTESYVHQTDLSDVQLEFSLQECEEGMDLLFNLDPDYFDSLNSSLAAHSTHNILSEAIRTNGWDKEMKLNPSTIEEKVSSFLKDDDYEEDISLLELFNNNNNNGNNIIDNNHNTNYNTTDKVTDSNSSCQMDVSPLKTNSKPLKSDVILKCFKSSFGKANRCVVKNVKFSVLSNNKLKSATSATSAQHSQPQLVQAKPLQAQLTQPHFVQPKPLQSQPLQPQLVQRQLAQPQLLQPQLTQPRLTQATVLQPQPSQSFQNPTTSKQPIFVIKVLDNQIILPQPHQSTTQPQPSTSTIKRKKKTKSDALYHYSSESSDTDETSTPQRHKKGKHTNTDETLTSQRHKKGKNYKKGSYSLAGFSDGEKYKRIRKQNNLASKKCRDKKKGEKEALEREAGALEEEKKTLVRECEELERRVAKWREIYLHVVARK